jgi:Zn-dependent protease with chaperone function
MVEPNKIPLFCRNGHQQPNADSRFCIYCGTPLIPPPAQQQFTPPQTPPIQQPPPQTPQVPKQIQPQIPPQSPVSPQAPPVSQPPFNQVQQPQFNQPPPQYNQNGAFAPNYYPQPAPVQPFQPIVCRTCGGNGQNLDAQAVICRECRWLRPLAPGYAIECSAFQWAEDGKAMSALRAISPLNMAAKTISEKVGRRWIEATFNGVRLNDRQLPEVYMQAVRAAQILGMSHMPDVYISGECMWDCMTYGTDKDSFVVVGTALAMNYRGDELLFLLAREMGHCRAGHALWKTVIRFFLGEQGPKKGIMAGGLFAALSPTALLGSAIEMPLLGWARQAEITADRAGLLTVGDEEIARRVLLSWSLKSPILYRQINVEAWLEQQSASDDDMTKLSELTTSSTPYITRRLKLMAEFAKSPDLRRWADLIKNFAEKSEPKSQTSRNQAQNLPKANVHPAKNDIRIKCSACGSLLRIPAKVLEGKQQIAVRCPNAKCGKLTQLKKQVKGPAKGQEKKEVRSQPAEIPNQMERNLNYDD